MNPGSEERLDALDRRAAAAVAALDRALPATPEWAPLPESRPRRRPLRPLLVAAAVLVLAVVGLAVSRLDGGNDQSTIAGETETGATDEFVRLVISDPAAAGLELTAAYDGTSSTADPEQESTLQGPADAEDPWADAVEVFTATTDPESGVGLYGEIVDLGGVDGSFIGGPATSLQWFDVHGRRHAIASTALDESELAALAREAVAAQWTGGGPLPGHQILRTLSTGDTFPMLSYLSAGDGIDVAAVGYRSAEVAFAVGSAPGGDDRYRAVQVFGSTRPVEVRGHEGVVLDHPGTGGILEIVWRENRGTVVRVQTYDDPDRVIDVLDALEPADEQTFDALVQANPLDDEHRLLEIPPEEFDPPGDPDENPPDEVLAEISSERNGRGVEALLYRNDDDEAAQFDLMTDDDSGGSSGSGSPLLDLGQPFVSRSSDGTRDIYGGIVPGEIEAIEIEVASPSRIDDFEQVPVDGSDAVLFVAWSDHVSLDASTVIVRVTLTDGRVIRYAA